MKKDMATSGNDPVAKLRELIVPRLHRLLRPPPSQNTAEWAEEHRVLSTESNVLGGKWKNFSYQVEPMAVFTDPEVDEIVICSSAQIGKTDIMLNIMGYIADNMPAGALIIHPTLDNARIFSRTRVDPMIRDCKALSRKMTAYKSRDKSSTILFKQFPGGFFRIVGAQSESDLASMPLPYILADEIDKYEILKKGGDAYSLALELTKMQPFAKSLATSTPSLAGESSIQRKYDDSDQRRFYVPCPHCGTFQLLIFENLKWDSKTFRTQKAYIKFQEQAVVDRTRFVKSKKNKLRVHFPRSAYYRCSERGCNDRWNDLELNNAVTDGHWRAHQPFNGTAGFHIWELYSPKRTMEQILTRFLRDKDDLATLHTFTNAVLGEVFNVPSESMSETALFKRREKYFCEADGYTLPAGGAVITCGVDVQHDRLEATVRLWGVDGESWGLEYFVWDGDVLNSTAPWDKLDQLLKKKYSHPGGVDLQIVACAIDTGWAATEAVYQYINKKRWPRLAVKGKGGSGEPLVRRSSKPDKLEVPLHIIGVNTAKNTLYSRSLVRKKGAGYIHWNENFNATYFEQFSAEKRIRKMKAGREEHVWENPPGKRNEALDCEVYAYAALYQLRIPDIGQLVEQISPKAVKARAEYQRRKTSAADGHTHNKYTDDI